MDYKYTRVGVILLILGVLGVVLNRKNLIIMLMSIELMLLAVSFLFLKISKVIDNIIGQIFTLMILTVAAAESAIGLAIFVAYYRIRGTIGVSSLNLLRG
uniref:NADH-ubiquinone oxidoreductase chain 4L n=1 Tax=Negombata magnifica TaxID=344322 RepID=A9DFW6_NEGMA|nr:NADH dehydrogenase subunit 4L [Negombata magnifica]CAM06607.1 NADH dehydrogenase subunit 4L [Negombata magnifica]